AERLGPAPVVADALADDDLVLEHLPDVEAEIADLEVLLLEMLVGRCRPVLGMPRQMDLAVLADGAAVRPDQDRGIEAPGLPLFLRELGIAQVETDALGAR